MSHAISWFIHSDAGLIIRITAGCLFFCVLAILDFQRHCSNATRWREYAILLAAVAIALLYGILNDQITSRISWEYFYYGKDLQRMLGPITPPNPQMLHWESIKVGMKATWTAGLLFGVVLLLANNPRKNLPQLSYRCLLWRIWIILLCCVSCAAFSAPSATAEDSPGSPSISPTRP